MFSDIFIERPRLAFVVAIVITLAGIIAITAIPIAQFPDIVPPQVTVTTTYPGASAAVVEATVAQPLEAHVNGVDKMIYMKSTSGADGTYTLIVSFEVGSNPDLNAVNVSNRVNQIMAQLPPEVQRGGVTVKKKSAALLQVATFYSPNGTKDALFLSNYATINVLDRLARVPGVGEAMLFGPLDYSMRIWLKPDVCARLGLTVTDVQNALRAQNVVNPAGQVGAEPAPPGQQLTFTVRAQGRLVEPEEFANVVVRENPDGSAVRVKDIARVQLGSLNYAQSANPSLTGVVFLAIGAAAILLGREPDGLAGFILNPGFRWPSVRERWANRPRRQLEQALGPEQ